MNNRYRYERSVNNATATNDENHIDDEKRNVKGNRQWKTLRNLYTIHILNSQQNAMENASIILYDHTYRRKHIHRADKGGGRNGKRGRLWAERVNEMFHLWHKQKQRK